jgi:hypothetical protein
MKKKQLYQIKNLKHKKHESIVDDYETQKQKHIEKLGTKMLEVDKKNQLFKEKRICNKFWDYF